MITPIFLNQITEAERAAQASWTVKVEAAQTVIDHFDDYTERLPEARNLLRVDVDRLRDERVSSIMRTLNELDDIAGAGFGSTSLRASDLAEAIRCELGTNLLRTSNDGAAS